MSKAQTIAHPSKCIEVLSCELFIRGTVDLQGLHLQIGVINAFCRGRCSSIMAFARRIHLLNRWRVDNGHGRNKIIRQASLHLPVLLAQGTPVHTAVHRARVTWRVLQE